MRFMIQVRATATSEHGLACMHAAIARAHEI